MQIHDNVHDNELGNDSEIGAGRHIEEDEADMAAAVFLHVHRACGEAAQVYPGDGILICCCERCEEYRVYTYETNGL